MQVNSTNSNLDKRTAENNTVSRMTLPQPPAIAPERITLARDHITNNKAVVTVEQVNYSDAMRAYRIYQQDAVGITHNIRPALRLVNLTDMLLVTFVILLSLPLLSSAAVHTSHLPLWLEFATHNNLVVRRSEQLEAAWSFKLNVLLLVCCWGILLYRLWNTFHRVYVEEILAIHGIGLQFATYNVHDKLLSKQFIDLKLIRNMIIHDAFWRYQPIFYLSSSIENWPRRLVYFEHTLPRLEVLILILRGLQHILYGYPEFGRTPSEIEEVQRSSKEAGFDLCQAEDSGGDDTTMNNSELNSDRGSTDGDEDEYRP